MKNSNWTGAKAWPENPSLEIASINIDAEAGWENVFKFVAALYRIPGVLSVERMDLPGKSKKGGKLTLRLTVSVLIKAAPRDEDRWAS